MPTRHREVVLPRHQWLAVRNEERFWDVFRLARIANSLSMAYRPLAVPVRYHTPRTNRDRAASLLYVTGVLIEGLSVSRALARHYRHLPQFAIFQALHSDEEVAALERNFLRPARNKATFHIDREVFQYSISELDLQEYRLASARSTRDWTPAGTYFDIPDELIMIYLTRATNDQEYLDRLEDLITSTAQLANRFMTGCHRLLPRIFGDLGARSRPPRPVPS